MFNSRNARTSPRTFKLIFQNNLIILTNAISKCMFYQWIHYFCQQSRYSPVLRIHHLAVMYLCLILPRFCQLDFWTLPWVTMWLPHVEQELFILPEYQSPLWSLIRSLVVSVLLIFDVHSISYWHQVSPKMSSLSYMYIFYF